MNSNTTQTTLPTFTSRHPGLAATATATATATNLPLSPQIATTVPLLT